MNQKLSECQICYRLLSEETIGIVQKDHSRSCKHYFHAKCITFWFKENDKCPIKSCEKRFDAIKTMPDFFESPKKWLQFADNDGDHKLDKKEVMLILMAVTVFDSDMVMEIINDIFTSFDKDNSGKICHSEFAQAEGLFELLRANSG